MNPINSFTGYLNLLAGGIYTYARAQEADVSRLVIPGVLAVTSLARTIENYHLIAKEGRSNSLEKISLFLSYSAFGALEMFIGFGIIKLLMFSKDLLR